MYVNVERLIVGLSVWEVFVVGKIKRYFQVVCNCEIAFNGVIHSVKGVVCLGHTQCRTRPMDVGLIREPVYGPGGAESRIV